MYFCAALLVLAIVSADSFRPVSKVLTPPTYQFDLCGTWEGDCERGAFTQSRNMKMIGKHGLFTDKFEETEIQYGSSTCDDNISYKTRYARYVTSKKETTEDGYKVYEVSYQESDIWIVPYNGKWLNTRIVCTPALEDGKEYNINKIECSEGNDILDNYRSRISEKDTFEAIFKVSTTKKITESDIFLVNGVTMTNKSAVGCSGVTFLVNLLIIIGAVVLVIIIVLIVFGCIKASKRRDLPVEEKPQVEQPEAEETGPAEETEVTVEVAESEPAPKVESEPAPVAEPEPAPVAEPEPAPVAEPEPAPVAEPEPAPKVEPEPAPAAEPAPNPSA